jgi:hypothetical protein
MKKSDAIKTLLAKSSSLVTKEQAEETIDILQKLGMKPPCYAGLMASGKKYDKNKKEHQGREVEIFSYWEPEDE